MMSLQAITEVAVHIGRFQNVEILEIGLYHLECRVFVEMGDEVIDAVPHIFQPPEALLLQHDSPRSNASSDHRPPPGLLPAAVVSNETAARTKTIHIHTCKQVVDVDDIIRFRIEHPINVALPVFLEVKLMFALLPDEDGGSIDIGKLIKAPIVLESAFHERSSKRFQLHGVQKGLHAYCPLGFDEFHVCEIDLMVHASPLDLRLRLTKDMPLSPYVRSQNKVNGARCTSSFTDALVELAQSIAGSGQVLPSKVQAAAKTNDSATAGRVATSAASLSLSSGEASRQAQVLDCIYDGCMQQLATAHVGLSHFLGAVSEHSDKAVTPSEPRTRLLFPNASRNDGTSESAGMVSWTAPSRRIGNIHAGSVGRLLAEDLSFVSAQLLEVWQRLLEGVLVAAQVVVRLLRPRWEESMALRWKASTISQMCPADDITFPSDLEIWNTHAKAAAALRTSDTYRNIPPHDLEDLMMAPPQSVHPIVFEQRYAPRIPVDAQTNQANLSLSKDTPGVHVIVLVHGFSGGSGDMRLIKNSILLSYPEALYLCSCANEDDTNQDIEVMGARLAREVVEFIQDWCPGPPDDYLGRLSFVTYSMGGLIIRSALKHLTDYSSRMFTFISFSTPHLGFVGSASSIVKTGLWVAQKMQKSRSLEQVSMKDHPTRESFIWRLAHTPGMEYFRHVALVSSYQDQYAPFESARIEMSTILEKDPNLGPCYREMVRALLDPLDPQNVIRIDINFHISETNLDTMIGRAAHIQFIENELLMHMLLHTHSFLFE